VEIGGAVPFGEYQYAVDDKGRVIIPPGFRDFVEDGMIVTRGMERCLYVFPTSAWSRIEKRLEELPLTDPDARNFVRFFYSGAAKAKLDSAGRVTLPPILRQFAEAQGNVIIAGAPNRLEVWNEARWNENLLGVTEHPPAPELLRELVG
jgi:MraZ protein